MLSAGGLPKSGLFSLRRFEADLEVASPGSWLAISLVSAYRRLESALGADPGCRTSSILKEECAAKSKLLASCDVNPAALSGALSVNAKPTPAGVGESLVAGPAVGCLLLR